MWPEILYFPDETRKMQDLRRVTGECSPSGSPGLSGSKKKGALRNFHPLCECEFRQITDISTFSGRIPEFTHSPADHRRMQPVRFVRFVRLEKEGETAELSHQGSGKVQSCVPPLHQPPKFRSAPHFSEPDKPDKPDGLHFPAPWLHTPDISGHETVGTSAQGKQWRKHGETRGNRGNSRGNSGNSVALRINALTATN